MWIYAHARTRGRACAPRSTPQRTDGIVDVAPGRRRKATAARGAAAAEAPSAATGRSSSPALLVLDELAVPGPNDARASRIADSLTGDGAAADGTERRRSRATASSVGESSVPGEKNCAGGRAGDRPLLVLELVLDELLPTSSLDGRRRKRRTGC